MEVRAGNEEVQGLTGTDRRQSWKTTLLVSRNKQQLLLQLTREKRLWQLCERFVQYGFKEWRTAGSRWRHGQVLWCWESVRWLIHHVEQEDRLGSVQEADMCLRRRSSLNISRQENHCDLSLQLILLADDVEAREASGGRIQQVVTSSIQCQFPLCIPKGREFLAAVAWSSAEKLKVKDSSGYSSFSPDVGLSLNKTAARPLEVGLTKALQMAARAGISPRFKQRQRQKSKSEV